MSIKKCEIRKRSKKIENQVKDQTIDRCKIGQELIKGHNWPKNMCNVNTKNSKMDKKRFDIEQNKDVISIKKVRD